MDPEIERPFGLRAGGVLVFLVAGLLSGPAPAKDGSPAADARTESPSVLLVTVDTLRADRLAADGPMPRLWKLAGRGYRFTTAHSPVPLTLPAHATVHTGLGPQHHGIRDNIGYALPTDVPTVAESFAAAGRATGAFVAGYPLDRAFGLARGFDVYDDRMTHKPAGGVSDHIERRADEVVDAALKWLGEHGTGSFFLWVHLFDPHDPYEAPPPFRGRHAGPYDDEVAFADHALGRLVDAVRARGPNPPWVFVTSDHGEALGDHGESTHGIFLYDCTLRVPLVVVPPNGRPSAKVIDLPVTLADLAPTILDVAGLPELETSDGRSLLPVLRTSKADSPPEPRPLYVESIHARRRYGWSPLAGFIEWPEKFVSAPTPELYDLGRDPSETKNIFSPERGAALESRLREIRGSGRDDAPSAEANDDVDLERLASLGYVGGSGVALPSEAIYDRPRPDPKDRIAAVAHIERGRTAMHAGKEALARSEFETALRLDPDNLVTLTDLGMLAMRSGKTSEAEDYFREGLRRDENAETLANNLGLARGMLNRLTESERAFRHALAIRPTFTMARFNLAFVLHRRRKSREALRELERVLREDPEFPGLRDFMDEVRGAIAQPPVD